MARDEHNRGEKQTVRDYSCGLTKLAVWSAIDVPKPFSKDMVWTLIEEATKSAAEGRMFDEQTV